MIFKGEEYKPIPGFDRYFVSRDGKLASKARGEKCVMRSKLHELSDNGYFRASFRIGGRNMKRPVHQMVARAWIGLPPNEKSQINHKNGKKTDNRFENLEWCTHAENQAHWRKYLHEQVRGEWVRGAKLTEADVKRIRKIHSLKLLSTYELGRAFGVQRTTISHIIRGETWAHI